VAIGKLGEILVIDRSTLTRSLRLLQKEGFLAVSKRGEKRQRFVSVTPKGEAAVREQFRHGGRFRRGS